MRIVPNQNYKVDNNQNFKKNELYFKFSIPFDKMTDHDFDTGGVYSKEAYVPAAPELANNIKEELDSARNCIIPLLGYTGIGKTHLMLNTLTEYYKIDIKSNKTYVVKVTDNVYDIILNCAHERYNSTALRDVEELLVARIKTIYNTIIKALNASPISDTEVWSCIESNKGEIKYYGKDQQQFSVAAFRLKKLLEQEHQRIRNFVFIYDDLESLSGEKQHTLIRDFLSFFECLRNGVYTDIRYKFLFCLRMSTFDNLCRANDIDTHRLDNPFILNSVPNLSQMFEKRFDIIQKNFHLLKNAGNPTTWKEAKSVLMQLSKRIDEYSQTLLFEINDYNISNALKSFVSILSNRYWTQKNKNIQSSFQISGEEYYINNANLFRVLFLGEGPVYCNNDLYYYPSIFSRPGFIMNDFIDLYLLQFYYLKYLNFCNNHNFKMLSCSDELFVDNFCEIFTNYEMSKDRDTNNRPLFVKKIYQSIEYMCDNGLLKKDQYPKRTTESSSKLYMTPMGSVIYKKFLENSILFEIFRDEFALDDNVYKTSLTYTLKQIDLFEEFYKYIKEFWQYERTMLRFALLHGHNSECMLYFGNNAISDLMRNALMNSIYAYYSDGFDERCKLLKKGLNQLKKEIDDFSRKFFQ